MSTDSQPDFNTVFLSLGSNLGNRKTNILNALKEISTQLDCVEIQVSSLYETQAWGNPNQPDFINCVAKLNFEKPTPGGTEIANNDPEQLLIELKLIEKLCGRVFHQEKWSARVVDIDILLYNNITYESSKLMIPHPRMFERKFVLIPLSEIASELQIPESGNSVKKMLANCNDSSRVSLFSGNSGSGNSNLVTRKSL